MSADNAQRWRAREKLQFTELLEAMLHQPKRRTRVMSKAQFVTALVLAGAGLYYVGWRTYLEREPMLIGILRVLRPATAEHLLARLLASLHLI